jgi:putative addiction module killer protein
LTDYRWAIPAMSVRSVKGISERRIDYGPGYRVYFAQKGSILVVLLAGGDKRTQSRDVGIALRLARSL